MRQYWTNTALNAFCSITDGSLKACERVLREPRRCLCNNISAGRWPQIRVMLTPRWPQQSKPHRSQRRALTDRATYLTGQDSQLGHDSTKGSERRAKDENSGRIWGLVDPEGEGFIPWDRSRHRQKRKRHNSCTLGWLMKISLLKSTGMAFGKRR
jgi:hypothetical protein